MTDHDSASRQVIEDVTDYDDEDAQSELADLERALCPYRLQVGEKICVSGCWEEPACITEGPWDDVIERWPGLAHLLIELKELRNGN